MNTETQFVTVELTTEQIVILKSCLVVSNVKGRDAKRESKLESIRQTLETALDEYFHDINSGGDGVAGR